MKNNENLKRFFSRKMQLVVSVLFIGLTLIGCNASKVSPQASTEPTTEATTAIEPTPSDQMAIVKSLIIDEMRVFDVGDHHENLYLQIQEKAQNLSEEETKQMISEVVTSYMDAYFKVRIGEILEKYNKNYVSSDVETLFNSTSRTALYKLITLYEWTFYQKEH